MEIPTTLLILSSLIMKDRSLCIAWVNVKDHLWPYITNARGFILRKKQTTLVFDQKTAFSKNQ
jgi:hypothetical protein